MLGEVLGDPLGVSDDNALGEILGVALGELRVTLIIGLKVSTSSVAISVTLKLPYFDCNSSVSRAFCTPSILKAVETTLLNCASTVS
jgi:hypothetical protein